MSRRKQIEQSSEAHLYAQELGVRIKQIRKQSGLTQKEFAETLTVSQPTMTRFESGDRLPDAHTIKVLVREFGCDLNWLILGHVTEESTQNISD